MGTCISACVRLLQWSHDRHVAYKEHVPTHSNAPRLLSTVEKEPSVLLVSLILERESCEEKIIHFLKRVFSKNPNLIRHRNPSGETLLYFSCKEGKLKTINFLLKEGCSAEDICSKGSALHACVHAARLKRMSSGKCQVIMEELLSQGCYIDAVDDRQRTAFHLAAFYNCIEIMELLHGRGCNVGICARNGMTSLHDAVTERNPEAVDFILKHHSEALVNVENHFHETALQMALECTLNHFLPPHLVVTADTWLDPRLAIIERLLQAGANPNVPLRANREWASITRIRQGVPPPPPLHIALSLLTAVQETQIRDGLLSLSEGHHILTFNPTIAEGVPAFLTMESSKYNHFYNCASAILMQLLLFGATWDDTFDSGLYPAMVKFKQIADQLKETGCNSDPLTLQNLCRTCIRVRIAMCEGLVNVGKLPLPQHVLEYLQFYRLYM